MRKSFLTTAALCLAAMPAVATNYHEWGGHNPSSAYIETAKPHIANVVVKNTLTATPNIVLTFTLTLEEIEVGVVYEHAPGNTPDRVYVTPPIGYVAFPPMMSIEEGATAVIQIHAAVMS